MTPDPLCAGCGDPLTGTQRKWCSPACQLDGARAARLAQIFNITADEYDAILVLQEGRCAVCRKSPGPGKRLAVDHSHRTGLVRGLLCLHCNLRVIGKHSDPDLLQAAADYLTDPPARKALGRDVVAPGRPRRKRKPRQRRKR